MRLRQRVGLLTSSCSLLLYSDEVGCFHALSLRLYALLREPIILRKFIENNSMCLHK